MKLGVYDLLLLIAISLFAWVVPWASAGDVEVINQDEDDLSTTPLFPFARSGQGLRQSIFRRGDFSELQDVPTSNSWVGPLSGTSGINWKCITSDANVLNLVAGSVDSGMIYDFS
jgi:hypothetical protein